MPLTDSLIAAWELDEASGNAIDSHSTHDLTETGGTIGASTGPGGAGGSRDFEAADTEWFAIADNADLSCNGTSFSIEIWVNLESKPAGEMDFISKFETVGDQREYRINWRSAVDRFEFVVCTTGATGANVVLSANNFGAPSLATWYQIIAWFDLETQTSHISVNDGPANTGFVASATGIFNGTSPLHIGALGRATVGNYADGLIARARLWKRTLTATERTYLYNSGNGRVYADLATSVSPPTICAKLFSNGIWTWFTTPVATYHNGKIYLGAADCTADQKARIAEYTIADGTASVISVDPDLGLTDDHNNPPVIRLASGKIFAISPEHNGDSFALTSTNVDDASAFDAPVTLNTVSSDSYAQIAQVTFDDTIYHFFRRNTAPGEQHFRTSDDDGATWSAATKWLTSVADRPYCRYFKTSGTRIDFWLTNGQPNEEVNSLYHGYITINASTGARTYHATDGTQVGDDTGLPYSVTDFTLVYDGTTNECWIWDGLTVNGQPTCFFAVFPSHGTTVHEYWRGRWNGSSWDTEKVCDAGTTATADYLYSGEANYSGGVCGDPQDEDICYVSREFGANDFRIHKVEKSGTWTVGEWKSEGSPGVNARPVAVNANGTTHVFWWVGRYVTFLNYSSVVFASPAPAAAAGGLSIPIAAHHYRQLAGAG